MPNKSTVNMTDDELQIELWGVLSKHEKQQKLLRQTGARLDALWEEQNARYRARYGENPPE